MPNPNAIREPTLQNKDITRRPAPPLDDTSRCPPVVTVMGHVDHGKTTLLDSLRQTRVVDQEYGGITQHIGAFTVKLANGEDVTFIDTPGHAAFQTMRARGANVTHIVVLVVAADDGVMEQTKQSIKMANNAGVPIIVAINKIDKPHIDIDSCKQELLSVGIQLEEFGGEVLCVGVSALTGLNLDKLVEAITTQAELLDVRAQDTGPVEAVVIESNAHPNRGKLCTAIIQRGVLRKGAVIVCGEAWARVRGMFGGDGKMLREAPPSTPVVIMGWKDLPHPGDDIIEVESQARATEVIQWRKQQTHSKKQESDYQAIAEKRDHHDKEYNAMRDKRKEMGHRAYYKSLPPMKKEFTQDDSPKVRLLIKGDVDGSVEAILDVLDTYDCSEVALDIIHYGVGTVTESDIELASLFNGLVYGFNVPISSDMKEAAVSKKVVISEFNVIYKLIDHLKGQLNKEMPLIHREHIQGEADILAEFEVTEGRKKIPVAGVRCSKGQISKTSMFRVMRGEEQLLEGKVDSIRHLKNEVNSIKKGVEGGLRFSDASVRFSPGDTVICYDMQPHQEKTSWDPGF